MIYDCGHRHMFRNYESNLMAAPRFSRCGTPFLLRSSTVRLPTSDCFWYHNEKKMFSDLNPHGYELRGQKRSQRYLSHPFVHREARVKSLPATLYNRDRTTSLWRTILAVLLLVWGKYRLYLVDCRKDTTHGAKEILI